jgi:phospholipase/carboxylesterase
MDRRRFLEVGLLATAAVPSGCLLSTTEPAAAAGSARLGTRWHTPGTALEPGLHALGFGGYRDGYIRVPAGYQHEDGAPFALLLHGAGGSAEDWSGGFDLFDELGLVVLGVDSEGSSWDIRFGSFGADVLFIDEALERTFDSVRVDPTRLAISGFSDGASYALSLGLANGDLFTHVLAFSPGFAAPDSRHGRPDVFLSHGTSDTVLPVDFTRRLAGILKADGHEVRYEEFDGGHALPRAIARMGYGWVVE